MKRVLAKVSDRNLAPNTTARVLSAALRVTRPNSHFFVHGLPGTEGNVVEIARALIKLTDADVVWPSAPPVDYLEAVGIPLNRVRRLDSTRSRAAMMAFLRARAVFHTHGLYGNPIPTRRQPIVNLWHGDSFKGGQLFPDRTLRGPSSTYIVSSSRLIGEIKARRAGLSLDHLLLAGNPRVTQMFSPAAPEALEAVGIDPGRPFVLWMPTFRIARDNSGGIAWSNTSNPETDRRLAVSAAAIAEQLRDAGVSLVVKPHMLDATSRTVPGAAILEGGTLTAQRVPLYSVIGASAGLISDYSSVWIDYLAIDRPVGFLLNDIDDFRQSREVTAPELISNYPGERMDTPAGVSRFIDDVTSGGEFGRPQRDEFRRVIGYVASRSSAEDVVRATLNL